MLEKGSYVIYGSNGVCRVTDIRSETMYKKVRTYYVLESVNDLGATIYVPVDNEALLARMRKIPDREEILKMLDALKDEIISWEPDNRLRAEQFNGILDRCDLWELLALIRTIREKRRELASENKKLSATDDSALKRAEKIINGEFGFVLSIPQEEVPAFIAERLSIKQAWQQS